MKNEYKVNEQTKQPSVGTPILIGAIIGFMLAALLVGSVDHPKPDWKSCGGYGHSLSFPWPVLWVDCFFTL